MKPVFQTIFGPPHGNCFAATLASILELSLEDVPNFMIYDEDVWWSKFMEWCGSEGYEILDLWWHEDPRKRTLEQVRDKHPELTYVKVGGESPRFPGSGHAAVMDLRTLEIVHDPVPLGSPGRMTLMKYWNLMAIRRK